MKNILLKNANIITKEAECIGGTNIYISDGKIGRMTAQNEDTGSPDGYETIDCSRLYVTSGMPNLHVHTAMNIFKGIAEDVNSDQWFNEMIFPYESKMLPQDVYIGTKLGIAEMINNGVTVFADHYFMEDEVLRAVKDTGIRASLAPTVFGTSPDFKERLEETRDFLTSHKNDSELITFHVGPHANYTCPPDTMSELVALAKELDLPLHLHIAEEEAQVRLCRDSYGETPFEYMARFGAYECKLLFAHGLWIEEDDLRFINERTMFAFCPKTYMKLGSGRGGFFRLWEKLNFGFGTDGAASSNTLNPVGQARLFALLGKMDDTDGRTHTSKQVWKRLMSGHEAFPFGTGELKEGSPADLVIWDLDTPDTAPVYHPVTSILYSSNSSNVRYTMVAGKFLKADGHLIMDEKALMEKVHEAQGALIERGKGKANVAYLR